MGMSIILLTSFSIFTQFEIGEGDFSPDDALFRLNWVQTVHPLVEELSEDDFIFMTTADNEKYRCFLPSTKISKEKDRVYTGPSAKIVLKSLFKQKQCVYKMEPYWTYELCHGKHLRQYHEEKLPGNQVKLLEFFLGYYEAPELQSASDPIPTKKIDGKDIPYYEVLMSNGTQCDIRHKKARLTRLHYICDPQGHNEMIGLEEVSTCEYEGTVHSPTLCSHPLYKTKDVPESSIKCEPVNGSPVQPTGYQKLISADTQNQYSPITPPKDKKKYSPDAKPASVEPLKRIDTSVIEAFLKGEYCLSGGGKGWWKYNFCYGKFVQQYHEEKTGSRSTKITLGTWNTAEHIKWYHSSKRLRTTSATTISQLYSNGDICDLTGKPRQVQVKLKCKEALKLPAVSLSLQEPTTCDYVLLIESSMFCTLISTVDGNGLFYHIP